MSRRPSTPSTYDSVSVSSAEADDEKYKYILILGPDVPLTTEMKELYFDRDENGEIIPKKNCLIIGDGIDFTPREEIEELKGDILPGARIDVIAHGTIKRKPGFFNRVFRRNKAKQHEIKTFQKKTTNFREFASVLSEATDDKPVEMHLWSCYGGLAVRDVDALPKGSVMVAHGSENRTILMKLMRSALAKTLGKAREDNVDSEEYVDYKRILKNLAFGSEQKLIAGISGKQGRVKFRIPTTKMFNEKTFKEKFRENVIQFKKITGSTDIKVPELSEEETKDIMANYLINRYANKPKKITKFLQTPEGREGLTKLKTHLEKSNINILNLSLENKDKKTHDLLIELGFKDLDTSAYILNGSAEMLKDKLRREKNMLDDAIENSEVLFTPKEINESIKTSLSTVIKTAIQGKENEITSSKIDVLKKFAEENGLEELPEILTKSRFERFVSKVRQKFSRKKNHNLYIFIIFKKIKR